ncbi:MAG: TraC family protein [Candidatus Saccharimonadales bacterium]
MSVFQKTIKKASSRQQIAIEGVDDGVLMLAGNRFRVILESSSINFELKSEDEQDAMIDTYQAFLNALSSPLQMIIRVREMDMDTYLEAFRSRVESEEESIYREQARHYSEFIQSLVIKNKILTRRFYIVIPYTGSLVASSKNTAIIHEQLRLSSDIVSKGLGRLGVQTRKLSSLEVLDMFYEFYSPVQAKRQSLTEQTMKLFTEAIL